MVLYRVKNELQWEDLIGKEIRLDDRGVIANLYSKEENAIYIGEYFDCGGGQTTRLPLNDIDKSLKILEILGYSIEIKEVDICFCENTVNVAKGLRQAGFTSLLFNKDDYSVDGVFQHSFLESEEVLNMRRLGVSSIGLDEIIKWGGIC